MQFLIAAYGIIKVLLRFEVKAEKSFSVGYALNAFTEIAGLGKMRSLLTWPFQTARNAPQNPRKLQTFSLMTIQLEESGIITFERAAVSISATEAKKLTKAAERLQKENKRLKAQLSVQQELVSKREEEIDALREQLEIERGKAFLKVLSIVMRKLVCRLWLNEVSRQ